MTQYAVYLSGSKRAVEAKATDTLSILRAKLGSSADSYAFVYFNTFTEKKTILTDRSVEARQTVAAIAFPDPTTSTNTLIQMSVVAGNKTDLFGTKTDWLYNRNAGVRITLNTSDTKAVEANKGKFAPIMLTDVQPSNESSAAFYDRVVVCEKGSIVNFNVSSWGAAGFGYSVASQKDTICSSLYNTFGDSPNRMSTSVLRRYKDSNNSIQIESTESLNIPTDETIFYQKVTVKTWRLTSYKKDGKTYSSTMQPPTPQAPPTLMLARGGLTASTGLTEMRMSASADFDPGAASGDVYIPGQDVETGAPSRGPESQQSFGSISNLKQDDPNNTVVGVVIFYFFVFKDHEAANRVINILNAPNPLAFG
ncbi:hypothetical protein CKO38_08205 [Rhodospirillum rubrum]|uniref:hypothetical protein n=1 Tax=Rhodospirillum rubrum TaxID=1085 RepID=UPI001905F149|nr:hypothetical protein [Rhodospirillum rubrum]MBK1664542.1 hypothetical protein [Rhodospirillum rubrum]MBK1676652.1 hypothetical protein [Rhodospirillum rubrum]